MKIAHVASVFPPYHSGISNVCYHNALEQAKIGHQVTVYTADYGCFEVSHQNLNIKRMEAPFRIGNAPFLPQLLDIKDVDIIHLHYPFPFGQEFTWISARRRGIPYVVTHHLDLIGDGLRKLPFQLYTRTFANAFIRSAAKIILVTEDHGLHSQFADYYQKNAEKIVAVPNGVDTATFNSSTISHQFREQLSESQKNRIIGLTVTALDRAHHFRRIDVLLHATAALPDVFLLIVGDGELRPQYESLAKDLGIVTRVKFLGEMGHDRLAEIYAAADFFVLPSHIQESFGMVLLEAMAMQLPVIASNLPGVRTVVRDGVNGLLVIPANTDDLREKMLRLCQSPQLRASMGKSGYHLVEEHYRWDRIAKRLIDIYESFI